MWRLEYECGPYRVIRTARPGKVQGGMRVEEMRNLTSVCVRIERRLAPVEVTNELWRTEGHELIGLRLVREFDGAGEELATITQWLAADEASGEPALFRAVHDDGDEEDLEEDEAREAIDEFNLRAMENEDWRTDGHPFLQKRALRTFGGGGSKRKLKTALGTVTKWLAAEGCEPALFRVVHDDGGKRARSHTSTHTALSPPCSL